MKRGAILASGRGSNLRALLEASAAGRLPMADFRVVISNVPGVQALEHAKRHGVRAECVDHRPFKGNRSAHEEAILSILRAENVEFLVLAGYMRLLTPTLINAFPNAMINIHPSLLPAFPGVNAQQQALDYGVRIAGCTAHFVCEEMDAGAIIIQRSVPVHPDDDADKLAARILMEEHQALGYAVDLYTRGRLQIEGRKVRIRDGQTGFPQMEGAAPSSPTVLIATGNAHKVEEIRTILQELSLIFRDTKSFSGVTEPEESAPDYLGNALIKARTWRDHSKLWTLADDSGLEVDALGGRPGVRSSRYAPTTEERNNRLLGELKDLPEEKRTARFVCTVALCGPNGEEFHASGTCEGRIAFEAKGPHGFGYDPIFIPNGFGGKHLAELSESTKNNISHRAKALFALKPHLERLARNQ